ncbi:MAG: hypothetical protein ACLGIN_16145 [Candidatus Sericytochromatia bacterium]
MANVGVFNDYSEVVVAISHLITPGHRLALMTHPEATEKLALDAPLDAVIAVVFRAPDAYARPIVDFCRDVVGGELLYALETHPATACVPIIVFALGVRPEDIPADVRFHTFLTFPEAIQELNPLLSGLFGPNEQDEVRVSFGGNETFMPLEEA